MEITGEGAESVIRENVLSLLSEYGGELIEVPYTYNEKVRKIDSTLKEKLAMPEYRRKRLKQLIKMCPVVKTIEAHSGLTGLIAEKTVVEENGRLDQFDAMWVSSLCDSTAKESRILNLWICHHVCAQSMILWRSLLNQLFLMVIQADLQSILYIM